MSGYRADPAALRAAMVARLKAMDDLARWAEAVAPWWSALAAVPRHRFIPDTIWIKNPSRWPTLVPVHRSDDPDRWLELTYLHDDAVITQIDDGVPSGPGLAGAMQTSSASAPDIVAIMLAALDAQPGHRVLEIGTGTGYNAALLAHRLSAEQVTSIEIDPDVAAGARRALSATGYGQVRTITADGALGDPPGSPFDRIIATAAANRIPYCWVTQTRPGGQILLPWANHYTGVLVQDGVGVFWLLDVQSRSWAKLTHATPDAGDHEFPVHQYGPRRLWDEVTTARQWWVDHGRPGAERWRFAVTANGQQIALR